MTELIPPFFTSISQQDLTGEGKRHTLLLRPL